MPGTGTVYIDAKLSVIRERAVGNGFHESITILNHATEPVALTIRIEAGCDFADLFEVKDALKKKGRYDRRVEDERLILAYERETFQRETAIWATARSRSTRQLDLHGRDRTQGDWTTDVHVVTALLGFGETRDWPKAERTRERTRRACSGTWSGGSRRRRVSSATGSR